jgi:alcohol dehydrogenase class IV
MAFSNASLGAVHAMAHSLGGLTDRPHGVCNAFCLRPVVAWNYAAAPDRYRAIAVALGLDLDACGPGGVRPALDAALTRLLGDLGLLDGFRDLGFSRGDLPALAANALRDPCMATNPRQPSLADVERLYDEAMG